MQGLWRHWRADVCWMDIAVLIEVAALQLRQHCNLLEECDFKPGYEYDLSQTQLFSKEGNLGLIPKPSYFTPCGVLVTLFNWTLTDRCSTSCTLI